MRSGNYIRALGRQSFEPSQHSASSDENLTPSEESLAMQRELVKAQNDVLATVGVCLRDTRQSLDQSSAIMAENEIGLLVGAVDLTVTYLTSWPFIGLRNRLQTYRIYEGLRYRDVFRMTWENLSTAQLLAGMPAHLCYQLVNLTRDYLQARFMAWLRKKPFFRDPKTKKPRRKFLLNCINKGLSASAWVLVYPLFYHSYLQTLQLLPPYPTLPSPTAFIPFSSASPLQFPTLQPTLLGTAKHLFSQAASSHFIWSFINQTTCVSLQFLLFKRILRLLPRPDYHHSSNEKTYLPEEEELDIYDTPVNGDDPGVAAIMIEEVGNHSGGTTSFTATVRIDPESGEAVPASRNEQDQDPLEIETVAPAREARSPTPPPQSPPPPPPPPPVEEESQTQELPPRTSSIPRQQYRHTTLSSHPVDVVASHAADGLANAITLCFESAVMRILARTFLQRRGVQPVEIANLVYPPRMLSANWVLVAKAMIIGEWGLMWALFEGTYFVSSFVGVRWFGYRRDI